MAAIDVNPNEVDNLARAQVHNFYPPALSKLNNASPRKVTPHDNHHHGERRSTTQLVDVCLARYRERSGNRVQIETNPDMKVREQHM